MQIFLAHLKKKSYLCTRKQNKVAHMYYVLSCLIGVLAFLIGYYVGTKQRKPSEEADTAPQKRKYTIIAPKKELPADDDSDQLFIQGLNEYLDEQLDNSELTIAQIAKQMRLSRTMFFTRIKRITGLSPVEYVRERRILHAANLLESGQYSVTEITYMVGLTDTRYLSKCFKHKYNMTPTEYRHAMNNKSGAVESAETTETAETSDATETAATAATAE